MTTEVEARRPRTGGIKQFREVSNNSRRHQIIHIGIKQFTEVSKNSRRGINNSRRGGIIHAGAEIIHGGMK